jgi:hypothetical protein
MSSTVHETTTFEPGYTKYSSSNSKNKGNVSSSVIIATTSIITEFSTVTSEDGGDKVNTA